MTFTEFFQSTGAMAGIVMLLIASSQLKRHLKAHLGL